MYVDPKSPTPIFKQIADQIRQQIRAGVFRSGEMLPSQRTLAIDLKVNPNTIQRAYETLEREGVVTSRRGVGMFVRDRDVAATDAAEKKLIEHIARGLRQAAKANLTPEVMRTAFETAIQDFLQAAVYDNS